MAAKSKWQIRSEGDVFIGIGISLGFLLLFIAYMSSPRVGGDLPVGIESFMSVTLFVFGYWYYKLQEHASKVFLGVLEIAAGTFSNWIQIGKINANDPGRAERLLFFAAATAVIAHGFKQIKEGRKKTSGDE
jgi:hypothetical protein